MKSYGKELIMDLHGCNPETFTRESISKFLEKLCDNVIHMEREDLHWWDYEGQPEEYEAAADHLKGTSCVQFISTSTIVIHTLDKLKKVFVNIFTCKDFDILVAKNFTENWFGGKAVQVRELDRL